MPAERCEGDHVVAFSKDGPTSAENGALLCGCHNRQKNRGFHTLARPGGNRHTYRPAPTAQKSSPPRSSA